MKKVFPTPEVAHIWANEHQEEGRNSGGNLYFYRSTIYSYGRHFPIAKHVRNEQGDAAVLFTTRTYSNTTAKHLSLVRNACSHLRIIYVDNPENSSNHNATAWEAKAASLLDKIKAARKPTKYLSALESLRDQINEYYSFLGIEAPATLRNLSSVIDVASTKEYLEKRSVFLAEEAERQHKAEMAKFKKSLAAWKLFKTSYITARPTGHDYLLYNSELRRIETSQGSQIPIDLYLGKYNSLVMGILKPGDKIMGYAVEYVDKKEVRVGCHSFKVSYLIKFTKGLAKGVIS